jgi:hypothetical protein
MVDTTRLAIFGSIIATILGISIYTFTGKTNSNTISYDRPSEGSVSSSIFDSDSSDNDNNERISTVSISSQFTDNMTGGKRKTKKQKTTMKQKKTKKTKRKK